MINIHRFIGRYWRAIYTYFIY